MTSIEQTNVATAPEVTNASQPSTIDTMPTPLAPAAAVKTPAKKTVRTSAKKVDQPVKVSTTKVVKPVVKAVATKTVTNKTVAKPAVKAAPTAAARVAAKTPVKANAKTVIASAATTKVEKLLKSKKPKLVRDSFTIPKLEYLILEELKQRSGKLGNSVKKSELIRAGIKALSGMPDNNFLAALKAVPAIKTGRPAKG